MKKTLLTFVFVVLTVTSVHGQSLSASTHYDVRRQTAITALNYSYFTDSGIGVVGFVESWYNPTEAYPSESVVLFSKNWLKVPVTRRVQASIGVEWSRNLASGYYRFPNNVPFKQGKFHIHPKIGVSVQIIK